FIEIAAQPAFAPVIDWMPAGADPLGSLAEAALLVYASTGDFTALHGLTGTHAVRVSTPFIAVRVPVVRHLFQALCAAYVSIGTPTLFSDAERVRIGRRE